MITRKVGVICLLILLALPFVWGLQAVKTPIALQTERRQNFTMQIIDNQDSTVLQTVAGRADGAGTYSFAYYGFAAKVKIRLELTEGDSVVKSKDFGPYTAGTTVNLTLRIGDSSQDTPSGAPIDVNSSNQNTTVNATTNVTANTTIQNSSVGVSALTGRVVGENDERIAFSNIYYYVGAVVLGALILLVVFRRKGVKKDGPIEPDHRKLFGKTAPKPSAKEEYSPSSPIVVAPDASTDISDGDKKIAELQKQIDKIRSADKVDKLKKQIAQEQEELKKLQGK